jgi:hypothetical protein
MLRQTRDKEILFFSGLDNVFSHYLISTVIFGPVHCLVRALDQAFEGVVYFKT